MKPVRKPWPATAAQARQCHRRRQPRLGRQGEGGRRSSPSCRSSIRTIICGSAPATTTCSTTCWPTPATGHNIVGTVFVDCHSMYPQGRPGRAALRRRDRVRQRRGGDERQRPSTATCAPATASSSHVDLRLGAKARRGVRRPDRRRQRPLHRHPLPDRPRRRPGIRPARTDPTPGLMARQDLARGLRGAGQARPHLRRLALPSADRRDRPTWPAPFRTPSIVLDHVGGPLGYARYAGRHDEVFAAWKKSMAELAKRPNVTVKVGGLGMAMGWFDFYQRPDAARLAGAGRRLQALGRDLHRAVRRRALHVREQLPGRQDDVAATACCGMPSSGWPPRRRPPRRLPCFRARRAASTNSLCRKHKRRRRLWPSCRGPIMRRFLLASLSRWPPSAAAPFASAQTLKVVMHSDVKILDPVWSGAYITRNHGYMIYDTLFAIDEKLQVKPQMVDSWTTSDDGLTWTFKLRDGLEWHDGTPVTSEDCVASLKRWAARDSMGQKLALSVQDYKVVDAKTFQIVLKEKFGPLLEALGKPSVVVPFMMPKQRRRDRPVQADRRLHRLRPVHLQEGRVEAGREARLPQEPQVQAAARADVGPCRRQGGQARPRRMGLDPRRRDAAQRADQRRDRHDRERELRPPAGAGEEQGRPGHHQHRPPTSTCSA